MTTSSHTTHNEKRMTASKALLNMKRAFPDKKRARYQKDRTASPPQQRLDLDHRDWTTAPPSQQYHHHPMSPAPVLWTPNRPLSPAPSLWTPALTPATVHPINARPSGQVTPPVVLRDLDRYILVAPGIYRRMSTSTGTLSTTAGTGKKSTNKAQRLVIPEKLLPRGCGESRSIVAKYKLVSS
jgi:hypothetical protein